MFLGIVLILAILAMAGVLLHFGRKYFIGGVCTITKRIDGKVVFITGANTGIGRDTAIQLAKKGATIIIACRDQKKGQSVAQEIQDLKLPRPLVVSLDLTDLKSVDKCAEQLATHKIDHIDILINNAGIMAPQKRELTKQGFEIQLGVNHIGHFQLTNKFVPLLQNAKNARIINVSSLAHERGIVNYDDVNYDKVANSSLWGIHTYKAYSSSKLMNVLHAIELNHRHETGQLGGFKAVSLHPGVVKTELLRNQLQNSVASFLYKMGAPLNNFISKTSLQGAQTTLQCALEDYEKLKGGAYYSDCVVKHSKATLEEAGKTWKLTEQLIKSQYHP